MARVGGALAFWFRTRQILMSFCCKRFDKKRVCKKMKLSSHVEWDAKQNKYEAICSRKNKSPSLARKAYPINHCDSIGSDRNDVVHVFTVIIRVGGRIGGMRN